MWIKSIITYNTQQITINGEPDAKTIHRAVGHFMNIFDKLFVYAAKWAVKGSRAFEQAEINAVDEAVVVDSTYGKSVCFFMKNGGRTYIPLSTESSYQLGDTVDLATAKIITLGKEGESDIQRVE